MTHTLATTDWTNALVGLTVLIAFAVIALRWVRSFHRIVQPPRAYQGEPVTGYLDDAADFFAARYEHDERVARAIHRTGFGADA